MIIKKKQDKVNMKEIYNKNSLNYLKFKFLTYFV